MKFLITGATGYIGSYLCTHLIKSGHQVIATSRCFSPEMKKVLHGCQFLEMDILDSTVPNRKLDADMLIHFAGANEVVSAQPVKGIELSVGGTRNLLQLAVNNSINRFIFFSTLQVYGSTLQGEVDESSPLLPENDYAMNHLLAEYYVEMFSRTHTIQGSVIRPANVMGKMISNEIKRWSLVPFCFCKEIVETGTITLKSSGKQTRNVVSYSEYCAAMDMIIDKTNSSFEVYNLPGVKNYSILEIAELVKSNYEMFTGKPAHITIQSELPKETNNFQLSLAKLSGLGVKFDSNDHSLDETIKAILQSIIPQ